jgi:hypothetical protein
MEEAKALLIVHASLYCFCASAPRGFYYLVDFPSYLFLAVGRAVGTVVICDWKAGQFFAVIFRAAPPKKSFFLPARQAKKLPLNQPLFAQEPGGMEMLFLFKLLLWGVNNSTQQFLAIRNYFYRPVGVVGTAQFGLGK